MLRLLVLLCVSIFVALLVSGQDHGQLRPGLARAKAEGKEIVLLAHSFSASLPAPAAGADGTGAGQAVVKGLDTLPPPIEVPDLPAPGAASQAAAPSGAAGPTAEAPAGSDVFTLAALPEIGGDRVRLKDLTATAVTPAEPLPQVAAPEPAGQDLGWQDIAAEPGLAGDMPRDPQLLYVQASSVNVRMGPSTETEVLDQLSAGEAVRVIADLDDGWTEILIEGDGVYGYVSRRFLGPVAP